MKHLTYVPENKTSSGMLTILTKNQQLSFQNNNTLKHSETVWSLIANMNSLYMYTAVNGSHIFSIEPLSKTGYWLGVCHGWFHLQGLTGGVKNASRVRITKLKILVHCGIRTRDLSFTKRARYHWATKADVSLWIKLHLVLPMLFLEPYL